MLTRDSRSSIALCSLTLFVSACSPVPNPPADSGIQDVATADVAAPDGGPGARGAATCAKLRMLGCAEAAMCEAALDPSTVGIPARCRPLFHTFVDCLDRLASTLMCGQLGMTPSVCTTEYASVNTCASGGEDAGVPPADSGSGLRGTVVVTVLNRVNESSRDTVFARARRGPEPQLCTPVADDGARCVYSMCPPGEDTRPYVSAGDITMTQNSTTETLSPDAMMQYPRREDLDFVAGVDVGVSIAGAGAVPSATINLDIGARMPRITLSQPMPNATIARSSGLPVRWMAEDLGAVQITLRNGVHQIECQGLPRDGSLDVSAALLARLPAGATTVTVIHEKVVEIVRDDWKFSVGAVLGVASPLSITLR